MIVCLGWGSLIWDLDGLPVEKLEGGLPVPRWVLSPEGEDIGDWKPDGPQVRVEFARQSGKERDRLTLVLHDTAERQPSLWARMTIATLDEVVRALTKGGSTAVSPKGTSTGFLTQMCARFSPSRSAAPWEEAADVLVPANQR